MHREPWRRRVLVAVLAAAALGAAFLVPALRSTAPRPNIVLVVWDTCRADRVSVNGYARPTTPLLASRASGGTVFRACFSPSCWTPPAHASLFTGLLPRNHGLQESMTGRLRPGVELLPATLREAGYETAAFVANPFLSPATGLTKDFEHVAACYDEKAGKGDGALVEAALDSWLAARAKRGERRPLFLFVNLMESHLPYASSPVDLAEVVPAEARWTAREAAAKVGQDAAFLHLFGIEPLPAATLRALGDAYDGAVRSLDRVTEGLLRRIEREGILDGALLAVAGDHGENLGEHGAVDHVMSPLDTALRVPLLLRWPGRVAEGRVEDAQVRLQDLYPVLVEAAGVRAPAGCGRDAVSLLESPLRPRALVAEFGPLDRLFYTFRDEFREGTAETFARMRRAYLAVREPAGPGARKLVSWTFHPHEGPVRSEGMQLFDPLADPGEERDLLAGGGPAPERERAEALLRFGREAHPPARVGEDQRGR